MTVDPKCSRRPALTRDKRPEQRICWYLMTFTAFVFVLLGVAVWTHIVASLEEAHREHIKARSRALFIAIVIGFLVSRVLKELGIAGGAQLQWAKDWHTEIGVLASVVEFMRRNWNIPLPPKS